MPMPPSRTRSLLQIALFCAFIAATAAQRSVHAAVDDFSWIEGEGYSAIAPSDRKVEISDAGKASYLSGGKWLQVKVEADKAATDVPDSGITLTYNVTMPKAASYAIWDRIGFEKIRSPFDWRVDNGSWHNSKPSDDTVDVEELNTWNPVAWLPLGNEQLTAGPHTFQVRLSKTKDDKGKDAQILYTSDALVFAAAPFHPNGPLKPWDTAWQTSSDKAATAHAFTIPVPAGTAQTATPLTGDWEITPDDELVVGDRLGPIKTLSDLTTFAWRAIAVPADRNTANPELSYVHRYYLRTRLNVPVGLADRSLILHFPSINMLASAFINGQLVGSTNTPFSNWDIDITHAIKPGQFNEIVVAVKDSFYALAGDDNAKHPQYVPFSFWHYNTWSQADMPVLGHHETGVLRTPTLITAGKAYTTDVFAKPSVKGKSLGLEVTVHNSTDAAVTVQAQNDIEPLSGGKTEKSFAPVSITIPAGQDATVKQSEEWPNPRLWWPDDPQQYVAVTRLLENGKIIDERRTKFGFREWSWDGPNFVLNGVPFHGRADTSALNDATEQSVALWRKHGQTMQRLWGEGPFSGMEADQALDFYDSHGLVTRRSSFFDGEGADGLYDVNRTALWDNYRNILAAWIKSQRNHPSIFCWSVENEITFINGHVTGNDAVTTHEHHKTEDVVDSIDPTRPYMVDGGNALLDESMPIYGGHYMEPPLNTLPASAYDKAAFAHRQVWPITKAKPILLGEAFYADGSEPADLATVGGEAAFGGKAEARPAIGAIARILSEGYRWNDINFQFWFGGETDAHYSAWQPIAAICREYDWTFSAGQRAQRTIGIFNDTRVGDPITLKWVLSAGSKSLASGSSQYNVAPGTKQVTDISFTVPSVDSRQEGALLLTLLQNGKQVFADTHTLSILPTRFIKNPPPAPAKLISMSGIWPPVAVYDPSGQVAAFLNAQRIEAISIPSLSALLTQDTTVIVIGKDALTESEAASSRIAAWASKGGVAIVLEQKYPLRYQGLPGTMDTDTNHGGIAFVEDPDNKIFKNLDSRDFTGWGSDGYVYRNAYVKPTSGAKSLVECDNRLADSALVQMPAGKGLLLLSQLLVQEKLSSSAAAQQVLLNMVHYARDYRLYTQPVSVISDASTPLTKALKATGLQFIGSDDPLATIGRAQSPLVPAGIVVLDSTAANLRSLAANPAKLSAFTANGGWLILNNVTPEGLTDFNKIVGWNHILRPYKQEKVTWPSARNPLTSGLATGAIVMGSGKQIFDWSAGQYPDTDAYSYVADLDEVAPFARSPFFAWDNITNNYTMNDGFWPLIINFPAPTDGKPYDVPITLARPEKITGLTWASDTNYEGATKINLVINGKTQSFDTKPTNEVQQFDIDSGSPAGNLTLQVAGWQHDPAKRTDKGEELIGIDNIWIKVARPAEFYQKVKPMLNIGALIEYPRGKGGIVLCNVKFKDNETNPENAVKKQAIIAAILRNLDAPFSGGRSVIAGGNLIYRPIDLSHQANQFTTDRGWFGDKQFTFADLPSGKQTFAGVTYNVYAFTTSPVPTAVMLGGNGIPGNLPDAVRGIPIGHKADALFFLQTARIDAPRSDDDIRNNRDFELARYVVHYTDGQTATIPLRQDQELANYAQKKPAALPGAQIAWSKAYAGTDQNAVAYSMQWNNPRPDTMIQSIDLEKGNDAGRGVPALLAITVAVGK